MRDQLGVAMRAELMPLDAELSLDVRVIEQLAVENDRYGAVFGENWLPAVSQADDAEPAIRHADAGAEEVAVLIGPAVDHRVRHAVNDVRIDGRRLGKIQDSRDAAHEAGSLPSCRQK